MAIIRPGHVIGAISGNLQSINFVQGRYGQYVRKRLVRTKKATEAQLDRRARFLQLITEWPVFGPEIQNTWNKAASLISFTNRLGIPRNITGFQLYIKMNLLRRASHATWPIPPITLIRTAPAYDVELNASEGGAISVDWSHPTLPANANAYIYGARSLTTSQTHFFNDWKYLDITASAPGANNHVITAEWDAILGHPQENEFLAVSVTLHQLTAMFAFPTVGKAACVA